MKHLIILNALLIFLQTSSCDGSKKFNKEFYGLEKSYVLNKRNVDDEELFYKKYKVNKDQFYKDSIVYYNSLNYLLNARTSIIGILLTFENDNRGCFWVKTMDPYSSVIEEGDALKRSEAAIVLIDNYILGSKSIIIRPYVKNIKYSWLREWYKDGLSKKVLQKEYVEYVNTL